MCYRVNCENIYFSRSWHEKNSTYYLCEQALDFYEIPDFVWIFSMQNFYWVQFYSYHKNFFSLATIKSTDINSFQKFVFETLEFMINFYNLFFDKKVRCKKFYSILKRYVIMKTNTKSFDEPHWMYNTFFFKVKSIDIRLIRWKYTMYKLQTKCDGIWE